MIPDAYVYRAANRMLTRYGGDALSEMNRLICDAVDHSDQERALLMLRIRLAIKVLQAPLTGRYISESTGGAFAAPSGVGL